jgi:hypothetical protein
LDFIAELLIQLIVQLVVEVLWDLLLESLFRGLAEALVRRTGRFVLGAMVGCGFGWAWGHHLTGGTSWPKLLWVSLILGGTALVLAAGRAGAASGGDSAAGRRSAWTEVFAPPWSWSAERLVGFTIINAGIAAGIAISFRPTVLT